jgi:hypothetical protein
VDPQNRYKHSDEENNIFPLLGVEYRFLDCTAGVLVATVIEPNQIKCKEQCIAYKGTCHCPVKVQLIN